MIVEIPVVSVHVRVVEVFLRGGLQSSGRPCAHAATYLQSWTQSLTCPLRPMTGADLGLPGTGLKTAGVIESVCSD